MLCCMEKAEGLCMRCLEDGVLNVTMREDLTNSVGREEGKQLE